MKLFKNSGSFKAYLTDIWNRMDLLGIVIFIIGFSLHCSSELTVDSYFKNNIFDVSR